ncbi:MAG TPA: hypothetical protein ENI57_07725 [Ignavibacteria bacterium]|nr:hypothetical protein [Ignavibacteria bacterium]
MRKKIILILILFFTTTLLIAQNKKNKKSDKLDKQVFGYVINNNRIYLVTDNGFLSVYKNNKTNKQWEDYYREIYNDSTIVNPNTIINTNLGSTSLNYIIPININNWVKQKYSFKDDVYLYDFIRIDSSGNYYYMPGVLRIIGNYKKNGRLVLPKHFRK